MRQGQQNRRGRGRNNNHQQHGGRRGGQNPLTRSFESTGPDTKIRGTPAHIAEKYMTLARDAQSCGDPVLAENDFEHAEHNNRIIMAYREQMQQSGEFNGGPQPSIARFRPGPQDPMSDEFGDGDGEEFAGEQQVTQPSMGEQPSVGFEGAPREGGQQSGQQRFEDRGDRGPRHEGQHRHQHQNRDRQGGDRNFGGERRDRNERFDRPDRQDRPDRHERHDRGGERADRSEPRFDRQPPMDVQPEGGQPRRGPKPNGPVVAHEQPEFLRRPVRRPRREESGDAAPATSGDEPSGE